MARFLQLAWFAVCVSCVFAPQSIAQSYPPPAYPNGAPDRFPMRYPLSSQSPFDSPAAPANGSYPPARPLEQPPRGVLPPADAQPPQQVNLPAGNGPSPQAVLFEPAQIVARVGEQTIMLGDLLGPINRILAPYRDKMPAEQLERQRKMLTPKMLEVAVENKLLYLDFVRKLKDRKQLAEIEKRVSERFYEGQVPLLVEAFEVNSPAALEAYLRSAGTSLERMRQAFLEQAVASQMLGQVKVDTEITHQQMVEYYRRHIADYETTAKARWEHMMVRFDKYDHKEDADQAIRFMGDRVLLGGQRFAAVAREFSHAPDAGRGGLHDWTTQGSLVSKPLDAALFSLPLNALSDIIEDEDGFHIIRVLERRPQSWIAFNAPAFVRIADYDVRQDKDLSEKVEIAATLVNAGQEDVTVELSAYEVGQDKLQRHRKSVKVTVPRGGTAAPRFELTNVAKQGAVTVHDIRLSIEPQLRIEHELRKDRNKAARDEYLAGLRADAQPEIFLDDRGNIQQTDRRAAQDPAPR